MNVRQKLSLAALSIALPVLASAQAAAPAAAPAAPAAPAFSSKLYGFALLTYNAENGTFKYPEYPSVISAETGHTNSISARQSRIGWDFANADAGIIGAKLGGKLEFDFMGGVVGTDSDATATKLKATPSSWDSALPRLRYAYANAVWDIGEACKVNLLVGQHDGLVNPLHPELGAYIALPTFMQAGNLTRRSPQIRLGYTNTALPVLALSVEVAALNAADAGGVTTSAGNTSGLPDWEARVQGVVKPMDDVKATIGVGYHTNKQTYDIRTANQKSLATSLVGVDVNIEATKYLNIRGEWFTGSGTDESYSGAFGATNGTAGAGRKLIDTTGFWVQGVVKPLPYLWVMGGYGQETEDVTGDPKYSMVNLGVLAPVGKNLRLGLEYTISKAEATGVDLSGNAIALSSRFSF